MKEPVWIRREECLVLFEMMVQRYGGVAAVRDSEQLEAALSQPRKRFASGVTGLPQLAACYTVEWVRNRPFASGNLGFAFILAATFLASNGLVFSGNELAMVETVLELAQGQQSEAEFAHYLRCNTHPIQPER